MQDSATICKSDQSNPTNGHSNVMYFFNILQITEEDGN